MMQNKKISNDSKKIKLLIIIQSTIGSFVLILLYACFFKKFNIPNGILVMPFALIIHLGMDVIYGIKVWRIQDKLMKPNASRQLIVITLIELLILVTQYNYLS
ncbi:hypothetical protein [Leuconostoc pseudomesenteroides]|uniref:hypothetical protein n=1 Tax=Leuconostoc pseudomesenteroides TaxID=33968 RepID=UPI001E3BF7F4|nr:hypothetical protein [Leuconostoc pseudomesenteroides]